MSGAQPMSEASALAAANAQRGPRSALAIGYGTTHVIFEPLDFMARLAALVPKPRVNLTRFHGVFVGVPHQPNSKYRALVTPAKRGKGNKREENCKTGDCESANRHVAMTCTRGHKGTPKVGPMRGRLKRVFTKSRRF